MKGVGNKKECHHENDKASHFVLDGVAVVKLLLPSLGVKDVQVPHKDGEDVRDSYTREDAHNRSQYQHETNHHTLHMGNMSLMIKLVAREGLSD